MPLPDEGLIHAWLDGQLPPEEAERVAHLVATDPAWEAAAAEARGLVAASSRILAALDDVPRGVLPVGNTVPRFTRRRPWWTKAAAAIVVIVGGSTLMLQRAPAPTIDELPRATGTVATTPVTPPATSAVTVERRDAAKVALQTVPAEVARTEMSKPQVMANAPVLAEALAPAPVPPTPEVRAVGGVMPSNAGGVPAQRVATPSMANQAAKALVGVTVAGVGATPTMTVGGCYALRDSKTSAATGIVMRGDRHVADTLFLAPLREASPMRGWVMSRDGVLRGVLTTEAEGRGMMLVTAAPASCTAP